MQEGVTVRDVMSREFVGVSEGDTVEDVVDLVVDERAGCAVVLRGSEAVGFVTAHDLLDHLAGGDSTDAVESIMANPPDSVEIDDDLVTALSRLSNADGAALPVQDDDRKLAGIVTESDILAASASLLSEQRSTDATARPGPGAPAEVTGVTEGGADAARQPLDRETSDQGVCESCGSLSRNLQPVNGQVICPECREV